jgi:hypothetical protein
MSRAAPIQNNFNGGEVTDLIYGRPDLDKYGTGLATCLNFIPLIQGPVERRPGTGHIVEVKDSSKAVRVVRFEFSTEQAYILEFGDQYVRFIKNRGQIISGTAVELATTYLEADLFQLQFSQSADVLYITHPSYPPRKLTRTSDTAWTITNITFYDGPFFNTNATDTTLTLGGTTGSVSVTASAIAGINGDTGFQTTDVGRLIRWEDPAGNWTYLTITARTSTTVVTAAIDGPDASATTATTVWRLGVWSETTGYPAASTFHKNRLAFGGATDTPQRVDLSRTGDFENFAPTDLDGTVLDDNAATTDLSADTVNSIRWMEDDEKGLVVGTVGGEWVVRPDDNGGALTPGNISPSRSSAFGSANTRPARVGRVLVFVQKALRKLRELAYVFEDDGFRAPDMTLVAEHITGSGVVQLAYQAEPQSIVWMCLTDGTLIGMTYDRDQQVLGFHRHTLGGYSDAYSNAAAKVESVAVIPNPTGTADELYMVVNRYVDGGTVRYIEYLKSFWDQDNDLEDAFFVDSGLTLDTPITITGITQADPGVVTTDGAHGFSDGAIVRLKMPFGMTEVDGKVYKVANGTSNTFELNTRSDADVDTTGFTAYQTGGEVRERVTSISGLDHLEGQTVAILAEGSPVAQEVVSSGAVTVEEVSKAQVGLPYVSDIQTLRYDAGARNGTSQGKLQRFNRLIIRLFQTVGGKVGPDADTLDPLIYREGGDAMDTAVPLFTGDVEVEWDGEYSSDSTLLFRQDQPLPATVLALMPHVETEDRQ